MATVAITERGRYRATRWRKSECGWDWLLCSEFDSLGVRFVTHHRVVAFER